MGIPFNSLSPIHQALAEELQRATKRVLDSGWYVLGPEVEAFEAEFAAFQGDGFAVGVANGTDAIELALRAAGVGPGDEVITVSNTAVPTVCAIERTGARVKFADIDEHAYTLDPVSARALITSRTRAIVAVHLYGNPADLLSLKALCERHGLALIEDCAQAHGASWIGKRVGTWGDFAAFSFYPTKNLGALGDGGVVFTRDRAGAERVKRLRNYGQTRRYIHIERGINSRLDELQAALLRVKLQYLNEHNQERLRLAARYDAALAKIPSITLPSKHPSAQHVFHLYVIQTPFRDELQMELCARGIDTLIHYPIPIHLQQAYEDLGYQRGLLPVTETIVDRILSLPLYVGMTDVQVETVATAVSNWATAHRFGQKL